MTYIRELVYPILALLLFAFASCSGQEPQQQNMNNFEKHFAKKFDAKKVSIFFERRKNQAFYKTSPDSFDCAVVTIIDSGNLSQAIDDEDKFQEEYRKIEQFMRDSATTYSDNLQLALTVIDTVYIEKDTTGFYSKGVKLTKKRKVEPFFVPGQ